MRNAWDLVTFIDPIVPPGARKIGNDHSSSSDPLLKVWYSFCSETRLLACMTRNQRVITGRSEVDWLCMQAPCVSA
jgi:hypothetical protein